MAKDAKNKETEEVVETPKVKSLNMTDEEIAAKFAADKIRRYVAKHPRTVIVQGTTTAPVRQPDNTFVMMPALKPIKIVFKPMFQATEDFAKENGVTLQQLIELIENHYQFTTSGEIRLLSPGEEVPGKAGPKIVAGARGTGDF